MKKNEKESCFVIMSFNKKYKKVYDNFIKPLIQSRLGLQCIRVDERPSSKMTIIDNIKSNIRQCRFVLADISQGKPNVYYEIGYAHALNKSVIFIKNKQLGKLPLDINSWNVIVYDSDSTNNKEMYEQIINMVQQDFPDIKIPKDKKKSKTKNDCGNSIVGQWKGVYYIEKEENGTIKNIKHDVKLTINTKDKSYEAFCDIVIDDKYELVEYLMFHNDLTGVEWKKGFWTEFIGTSWKNTNEYLLDYWLDVYAINKKLQNGKLQVKIWDNVNKEKQDVLFERI